MAKTKVKTFQLSETSDRPDLINEIEQLAEAAADFAGFSEEDRDSLAIALTELGNNAINHGNKRDPHKRVHLKITSQPGEVRISVSDEGGGFNPDNLKNPLDPENLLNESGRGVFIVRSLMDEVDFSFTDRGTTVTIVKRSKT